jgi:hypothetical protein
LRKNYDSFDVKKLNPKEAKTFEELLISNVYTQEALINLLEKKGIINKKELLEEIKRLRREQSKANR